LDGEDLKYTYAPEKSHIDGLEEKEDE